MLAEAGGRASCLADDLRAINIGDFPFSACFTAARLPFDGVGVLAVTVMLGSLPAACDMGLTTICTCDDINPKTILAFPVFESAAGREMRVCFWACECFSSDKTQTAVLLPAGCESK